MQEAYLLRSTHLLITVFASLKHLIFKLNNSQFEDEFMGSATVTLTDCFFGQDFHSCLNNYNRSNTLKLGSVVECNNLIGDKYVTLQTKKDLVDFILNTKR